MAKKRSVFDQVMSNPVVTAKLLEVAERKAAAARRITSDEGGSASITVRTGLRPKGRVFAYIESDRPDEEYGIEGRKRIRALGRAAREG